MASRANMPVCAGDDGLAETILSHTAPCPIRPVLIASGSRATENDIRIPTSHGDMAVRLQLVETAIYSAALLHDMVNMFAQESDSVVWRPPIAKDHLVNTVNVETLKSRLLPASAIRDMLIARTATPGPAAGTLAR